VLPATDDEIEHEEPAAEIDPTEAAYIAHEQWATSRIEHHPASQPVVDQPQECQHVEPPMIADDSDEFVADLPLADAVERGTLAGEHVSGDGEGQAQASGETGTEASASSGPSSSSKPTTSSGNTKVNPEQISLCGSGLMPVLQGGGLPSYGSMSHLSEGRCLICKPSLPGGQGCKKGPRCHKCHMPHGADEVLRGGGGSRQRMHRRVMQQTDPKRYPSPDPFEAGEQPGRSSLDPFDCSQG